jgi:mono/diheme cytochrome c family protein
VGSVSIKRILKWFGIGFGGFIAAVLLAALSLFLLGGSRTSRTYDIPPEGVVVPTDAASVARGKHLLEAVTPCSECHADDYSGDELFDVPGMATLYASNLTSGEGGIGGRYTDWVRAIRHGVDEQGNGLWIMPSEYWNNIGDADLGAMIAYLKTLPPVDNVVPERSAGVSGRIAITVGLFGELIPAQLIDHGVSRVPAPEPGETAQYGRYLVSFAGCRLCHGDNLGGGTPPDSDLRAPNITDSGAVGTWSLSDFTTTLRAGVTPGGNTLDSLIA